MPRISGNKGRYAPASRGSTTRLDPNDILNAPIYDLLPSQFRPTPAEAARQEAALRERLKAIPRAPIPKPKPPLPYSKVVGVAPGHITAQAAKTLLGSLNKYWGLIETAENLMSPGRANELVPYDSDQWKQLVYPDCSGANPLLKGREWRVHPHVYGSHCRPCLEDCIIGQNLGGDGYPAGTVPGNSESAWGVWARNPGNGTWSQITGWSRDYTYFNPAEFPPAFISKTPPFAFTPPAVAPIPAIWPEATPILGFGPFPLAIPYAAIPGVASSNWPQGRSVSYATPPASAGLPSPFPDVTFGPPGSGPPQISPPTHAWQPPGPGVKERKARAANSTVAAIFAGISAVTETRDAINAVYDALPKSVRNKAWGKYAPKGQVGVIPEVPTAIKAALIYRHADKLDVKQAIINLALNHVEDSVIGSLSQGAQRNLNAAGYHRPVGIGAGPAI